MGEVAGLLQVERTCVPGELAVSSGEGANEWRSCQRVGKASVNGGGFSRSVNLRNRLSSSV